jgi:TldD protein
VNLIECASDVLNAATANGGDFAEIYVENRSTTSLVCEESRMERAVSGAETGAGVRVLIGERTAYAYTNDVTVDGLMRVARRVADGISAEKTCVATDFTHNSYSSAAVKRPDTVDVDRKVAHVRAAEAEARRAGDRVRQVLVRYGDTMQHVAIANSAGQFTEDERIHSLLLVQVVAEKHGIIQTGYEPVGGCVGFELFDTEDPVKIGRLAAEKALLMLDARPAPAGVMPVIVSGEAGGTMIHEAVGHGLEADLVQKNMSVYAGKVGEQVAARGVTVVDDATIAGKRGTFNVDDEGTPAQRTVLIEDGILKGYMYSMLEARREGCGSTGNGRRESYRYRPIPRMTNTIIMPGDLDPAGIIAETEHGLLVNRMGGGQVNTVNGDFQFEVSEGYLLKNGEIGEPVRGAALVGNGLAVLANIDRVGNDLGFGIGTCGKDGQGVPVSDAQPTIRVREMTVGGTDT